MNWSRRIRRGKRRSIDAIAAATAFLAFAVRFYWTTNVQNPLNALYSDMGAYYSRALDFIDDRVQGDPRGYAFFPWGAHVLIGGELWLVGRTNATGIAIIQSIVSAIPAVCVVYFTARLVKSRWWILFAGFTAALWQPSIVHAGFFMSEIWYSAFLVVGTLLFVRYLEGKRGAFGAGLCLAIAIVVRPQALMTFGLVGGVMVLAEVVRPFVTSLRPRTNLRGWVRFAIPIVLILGLSAYRFHALTHRWGLVSENGAINRAFGATHLGRIESYWTYNGGYYSAWYTPPAKSPVRRKDTVVFRGYIGEEGIIDRIREDHYALENTEQHVQRMFNNTTMLIYRFIFPEDDFAANGENPARAFLQRAFREVLLNMLPVSLFGLLAMLVSKRQRVLGMIFLAHAVTLIVVAALYFAEARMRMPYDPFVIAGCAAGCSTAYALAGKAYRQILHWRGRPS